MELYLKRYTFTQIQKRIYLSLASVANYVTSFAIVVAHTRDGHSVDEIAFLMSKHVIFILTSCKQPQKKKRGKITRMKEKEHYRESYYRPQAAKTLRVALKSFIRREFPRLGGPWVIDKFVDKLLGIVDQYRFYQGKLTPGQIVWPAMRIDDPPVYRKPIASSHQIPVINTIVNQDDMAALRNDENRQQLLKQALVRAANDAYAQGGVLSCADLGLLFQRSPSRVSTIIRKHEEETNTIVPRRGNIHDMGRTITHKGIICRKAYLEGKVTPQIAQETCHSPEAVDNYVLDFARVFFAIVQRGMSVEEAAFAIQRPPFLVDEYLRLIREFGLIEHLVYQRSGVQLKLTSDQVDISPSEVLTHIERREQDPIAR